MLENIVDVLVIGLIFIVGGLIFFGSVAIEIANRIIQFFDERR